MADLSLRNDAAHGVDGAVHDAASVGDFVQLLKPRVMSLVVFSGFAGLYVAPGHIHPFLAAVAVLCIGVAAGASGAINMWYDRDIDAVMRRTRNRPLPAGRMDPAEALGFGVVLSLLSVLVMALAVNYVAATLLAIAIAFYVFVYTIWLKRRTPQNIVIGGAAGAFPPMIGWAATTGEVSLVSLSLFALIFMWTPPHFWALALVKNGDYKNAGVPMLPVVAGDTATKRQMLVYTILLLPVSLVPCALGFASLAYASVATVMSLVFIGFALRLLGDAQNRTAMKMFSFSLLYLFVLFAALIADRALGLA